MVLLIQLWNTKNNDRTQFEKISTLVTGFLVVQTHLFHSVQERGERERGEFQCSVIQNISTLYIFSHF